MQPACLLAEFRGPGVHHNFDDSDSGYDVDAENKGGKTFGLGGYKGRIIFLGDGTEVLTDTDDTEMFDNSEEDKDLDSQVSKAKTQDGQLDNQAKEPGEPQASTDASTDASAGASASEPAKKADDKPQVTAAENIGGPQQNANGSDGKPPGEEAGTELK